MNDHVLQALMQLFAIGERLNSTGSRQREFVGHFLKQNVDEVRIGHYLGLFDRFSGEAEEQQAVGKSGIDNDVIHRLCHEINRGLEARQKFVVYVRLCEFVFSDAHVDSKESYDFLVLIAEVFRLSKEEAGNMRDLCRSKHQAVRLGGSNVIRVHGHETAALSNAQSLELHDFDGQLWVINLQRAGIMIFRYEGSEIISLNGLRVDPGHVHVLSQGGIIRNRKGATVYHSDLLQRFLETGRKSFLRFETDKTTYRFKNNKIGLHEFSLQCRSGELVAIMGGSGAGKSTLLNLLNGNYRPSTGKIMINGVDVSADPSVTRGLIGNIPQDDLLIEELSVFDNLFYNSKLCFGDLDEWQLTGKVNEMLKALGLWESRNLKVGDPLNKSISGGQRKRLNIALELIREPAILFVDEPTSGLSSKDAENVMDLLKQLALGGKLVFVVIHQPSSDIFKLFDRLVMLDKGGYLVFDGRPVEAINHFRREAGMVDSSQGVCLGCGTIQADQIFNILEQEVIDEYGNRRNERRITPEEWYKKWQHLSTPEPKVKEASRLSEPVQSRIAGFKKQWNVFLTRDLRAKLANRQYLLINLLEAPALAAVLASLLRFTAPGKDYSLYMNDNIPAYLFMGVVVALFLGLSVSGEEILRDRRIRKRESFLHLSRTAYLWSKIVLLFSLSAIQMASFVLVGNTILGIHGMYGSFFLVLLASAFFSNILGLNISSMMKTSVAVYILIPILIIPQILLSGVIVRFNKLNSMRDGDHEIPLAGNLMVSRWAFEALSTQLFKENDYHARFYPYDRSMSRNTYVKDYWVREMQKAAGKYARLPQSDGEKMSLEKMLRHEMTEGSVVKTQGFNGEKFREDPWSSGQDKELMASLETIRENAIKEYNRSAEAKDALTQKYSATEAARLEMEKLMMDQENQALTDMLMNQTERVKIFPDNDRLVQQFEPVYRPVDPNASFLQQPYFIAEKRIFGKTVNTLWANLTIIFLMTLVLYVVLQSKILERRD